MQSLKDKLLKAGLVSEEQAKKAEAEKATRPPARARPASPARPVQHRAPDEIPKLPPLANSKEANRHLARQQLELDRKLREKVLAAEVPLEAGSATFHFVTRKGKLRRLELSEAQQKKLEQGELAVVERPDPDQIAHALVPAAVALELKGLSERCVRFLNKDGEQVGFVDAPEEVHAPDEAAAEKPEAPTAEQGETWLTVRRAKP
jgi:uncharacterized protein YaiL (DUF2058 family)